MPSVQIDVPVKKYRLWGRHFIPKEISAWMKSIGISHYEFCGSSSYGDGHHVDRTSNIVNSYFIEGVLETDCVAFKIQFPECKIHFLEDVK